MADGVLDLAALLGRVELAHRVQHPLGIVLHDVTEDDLFLQVHAAGDHVASGPEEHALKLLVRTSLEPAEVVALDESRPGVDESVGDDGSRESVPRTLPGI